MSWFSVKVTAVLVALRRTPASPIAALMIPEDAGRVKGALAALAG